MAPKGPLLAILCLAAAASAAAQMLSTAPAPSGPNCEDDIIGNLATCLEYVAKGSNATKPSRECCSGLSTVVKTRPTCLCELLGSNFMMQYDINGTRAFELPDACDVHTPPLSSCNAVGVPVASPASSPSPMGGYGESPAMSPGPPPEPECETLAENNLLDCLDYVSNDSNETKVKKGCCSGFSSIIDSKSLCLCELVAKNSTFADDLDLNRSKALTLPDACNVTIPPFTLCSAAGYEIDIPGIPSSPPPDECAGVVVSKMAACISYVQEGGNATRPKEECCSGYSKLVDSNPDCLCKLVLHASGVLPGFKLNQTRAIELPTQCEATLPACTAGGETPAAPGPGSDNDASTRPRESNAIRNLGGPFNVVPLLGLLLAV